MAFAPSADSNDACVEHEPLYGRCGTGDGNVAAVYELTFAAPAISAAAIAAAPVTAVSYVKTINTGSGSVLNPDSPDPSGLEYIPAGATGNPSRDGRLVIVDGEVEEVTGAGFHNANVWWATTAATATATFDTTVAPTNPTNKEPVGAAYDQARNELYIVKDGAPSRVWVYNATTMAQVRTFDVSVAPYNDLDDEGLGFGAGILYMVDAKDNDLVKVEPGPNGVVGNGDDVVTNYDLEQYGQTEPEGLDVNPDTGNIWVVSNKLRNGVPEPMVEVTPNGALVSTSSIAAANANSAAGLAFAPPSAGGAGWSIYIADRGIDNSQSSNENDGKIYEFALPSGGNSVPTANSVGASTPQDTPVTVTLSGSDVETCDLAFTIVTTPLHGAVDPPTDQACAPGGPNFDSATILYTPASGYTGPDSFTYRVSDGTDQSAPATVTVSVGSGGGSGIAFRAAANGANTGGNSVVLPKPAGTFAGDVLLAAVAVRGTPTVTAPAGWSTVRTDARTTTYRQVVFVHVVGGSEPSSYTFTFSVAGTAVGTVAAYSGVDNANPIDVHGGQVTSGSATITAPSVTTTASNDELVAFFAITGNTTIGTAGGMLERTEIVSPKAAKSKLTASLDDEADPTAGPSGARTATAAASGHGIGQLVALRAAP